MYRPDQGILKHALKLGKNVYNGTKLSPKIIKEALSFPLISVSDEEHHKLTEFAHQLPDEDKYIYEPVFEQAVVHYSYIATLKVDDLPKNSHGALHPERKWKHPLSKEIIANGERYEVLKTEIWAGFYDVDNPVLATLPYYPSKEKLYEWFAENPNSKRKIMQKSVKFLFLIIRYENEAPIYIWNGWVGVDESAQEICMLPTDGTSEYWVDDKGQSIDKGLKEYAAMSHQMLLDVFLYSKYGERHAVCKTPAKPKPQVRTQLNSKRPWTTATGPHILFLDKLPIKSSEGSTGTGTPKKPHKRRGHWRILQDPRYRHHPQYGKRIYVKPSFIGPEQTEYEGNIYKLIKPLDEIL